MSAQGLLIRALEETRGLVESNVWLCSDTGGDPQSDSFGPLPGTLEPECVEEVERQLTLIRDIEAWLGVASPFSGPAWLDDLIALRGDWAGGVR